MRRNKSLPTNSFSCRHFSQKVVFVELTKGASLWCIFLDYWLCFLFEMAAIIAQKPTATGTGNLLASNKKGLQEEKMSNQGKEWPVEQLPPLSRPIWVGANNHKGGTGTFTGWVAFHTNSHRCLCPSYHLKHFLIGGVLKSVTWLFDLPFQSGLQPIPSQQFHLILGRSGLSGTTAK